MLLQTRPDRAGVHGDAMDTPGRVEALELGGEEDVGGFGLRVAEARGVDALEVGVGEVEG